MPQRPEARAAARSHSGMPYVQGNEPSAEVEPDPTLLFPSACLGIIVGPIQTRLRLCRDDPMSNPRTEKTKRAGPTPEARRHKDAALVAGGVGTFAWDVVADRLWGDANFERLVGIELDKNGAAPMAAYLAAIHPDDRTRVESSIRRALETGAHYEAEHRVLTGDEPRWLIARGKAEYGADGKVARFPGVVVDVTERRIAADALRESEAKYRAVFETMDQGFCIIEVLFDGDRAVDYRFLEGNPAWEQHTGLVGALGRTAREVLPDLEEHWFETYGNVARTGRPIRFEAGSDVMGRWFDVYAFRLGDADSRRVGLLFKDISEQKRIEQELSRSRERFRAVLENALDAAYRRDLRSDTYDYLSPRIRAVLGIDVETMRAMPTDAFVERVHPDDRDGIRSVIEEGIRSGRGRIEYRFRTDDGEYRWLSDHFTVQTEEDGTPIFRTGIVRDASERKRTEAALGEARDAAEEASRAKSRFLAVMSHELRTPLTGVVGFADLLETEVLGPVTPRQQESLARIKASSWHLISIIDEILSLSRAEAGSETIRLQAVDAAELAREVVGIVEPQAREKGLEIDCAGADTPAIVITDPGKLRQILINLTGNAVKYTVHGRVEVGLDRGDPDVLRIHVHDTGPGIAVEDHQRIFEAFTQIDSSHTRPGGGTGLGLAIGRRLAGLLGGDIALKSNPGEGSTFTLTIPARDRSGGPS